MSQGNINYEINYVSEGNIKYPESISEAEERYVKTLKKILEEFKNKESNLIILVIHGLGVSACCKYLCDIITL